MSYIDGFIIAVPKSNKQSFIEMATSTDSVFMEWGALRILECWEDDVPDGTSTDFRRAVKLQQMKPLCFRG